MADEVSKEGAQTWGKLLDTALLRSAQGDARMLIWFGARQNLGESTKRAQDGLTASGGAPTSPRE